MRKYKYLKIALTILQHYKISEGKGTEVRELGNTFELGWLDGLRKLSESSVTYLTEKYKNL